MYCKFFPKCKKGKFNNDKCKIYFLTCKIYKKFIKVNSMDIQDILAKAFDIGNKVNFQVRFYENNEFTEVKQMTYTELGMFLIKNSVNITSIDIQQIA